MALWKKRFILWVKCLVTLELLFFLLLLYFHFKADPGQSKLARNFNIVIIGSGPTGLGAAQRLNELRKEFPNITIAILEQSGKPGGLAASERDDEGFLWDMGGHVVFSHYDYFDAALDRAVKAWNKKQRAAYAFMRGSDGKRRFIPYPVQNNIAFMDKVDQEKSLSGLEQIAKKPIKEKPANFDRWLLQNFGDGLCEVFMRKYNRKVWTVDPTEMNSVWMSERVAVPDIGKIKAKISAYDSGRGSVEDSAWGPNSIFKFPRYNGTGGIWKAVADLLPTEWFKFRHKIRAIDMVTKSVIVETGENKATQVFTFDSLVSTMPLNVLVNMLKEEKDKSMKEMKKLSSQLVYSHTHVIGLGLRGQPPQVLSNKTWIYFPDSDSPFYRMTVFSSYSDDHVPKPGKQWSLLCEVAEPLRSTTVDLWMKNSVIDNTIQALIVYGFITSDMIISKYYRKLDHGYPVPSINRETILETIQPWLESKGIYSRGRFGGWRYEVSNQDHSFMQGVEIIDKLLRGIKEETYFHPILVNSRKNTGRFLERLQDYEIVIAHYNETLDWVEPIANHCHVYHKGNDLQPPPMGLHAWDKLANVGRESHTYLHHIISNYDKLAGITVFLQGEDLRRNNHTCFHTIHEMLRQIKNNVTCRVLSDPLSLDKIRHHGKWLKQWETGEMRRTKFTLGEFYQELFGIPPPKPISFCLKGCFAATRQMIQKHSIHFYIKAISFVDDHANPEEGHYFERLWNVIFS